MNTPVSYYVRVLCKINQNVVFLIQKQIKFPIRYDKRFVLYFILWMIPSGFLHNLCKTGHRLKNEPLFKTILISTFDFFFWVVFDRFQFFFENRSPQAPPSPSYVMISRISLWYCVIGLVSCSVILMHFFVAKAQRRGWPYLLNLQHCEEGKGCLVVKLYYRRSI